MSSHEWLPGDKFVINASDQHYIQKVQEQNLDINTTFYREGEIIQTLGNGNAIVYFSKKCQDEYDTIPLVLLQYVPDKDSGDEDFVPDFVPFQEQRINVHKWKRIRSKNQQRIGKPKRRKLQNISPKKKGVMLHKTPERMFQNPYERTWTNIKKNDFHKSSMSESQILLHWWKSLGYQLVD